MNITIYTKNILESGTVTVTGTPDTGYPESRLYDRSIDLFWKDTVVEAKAFTVDQGATDIKHIDFLAIEKHNFNGLDMQWQYSTDNFGADIHDAVVDWTQADNDQIIKVLPNLFHVRYWRVTTSSATNPMCSEVYMSQGREFPILAKPNPKNDEIANVQWNKTIGGIERSTKFGSKKRARFYSLLLTTAELADFRLAMAELDDYSKPFYIKDHEDNYFMCRLLEIPQEDFTLPTRIYVNLSVTEML